MCTNDSWETLLVVAKPPLSFSEEILLLRLVSECVGWNTDATSCDSQTLISVFLKFPTVRLKVFLEKFFFLKFLVLVGNRLIEVGMSGKIDCRCVESEANSVDSSSKGCTLKFSKKRIFQSDGSDCLSLEKGELHGIRCGIWKIPVFQSPAMKTRNAVASVQYDSFIKHIEAPTWVHFTALYSVFQKRKFGTAMD